MCLWAVAQSAVMAQEHVKYFQPNVFWGTGRQWDYPPRLRSLDPLTMELMS